MLSFIYRISQHFVAQNGYRPNILYLNNKHYEILCRELDDIQDLGRLTRLLGMDIMLSADSVHPSVAWTQISWRGKAASA